MGNVWSVETRGELGLLQLHVARGPRPGACLYSAQCPAVGERPVTRHCRFPASANPSQLARGVAAKAGLVHFCCSAVTVVPQSLRGWRGRAGYHRRRLRRLGRASVGARADASKPHVSLGRLAVQPRVASHSLWREGLRARRWLMSRR